MPALARRRAPRLSSYIVGSVVSIASSHVMFAMPRMALAASHNAMYSAALEESAVVS